MKRRSFLQALGLAPVVGPAVLQDCSVNKTLEMNPAQSGLSLKNQMSEDHVAAYNKDERLLRVAKVRAILSNPALTRRLRDHLRRDTIVSELDPDLRDNKSFSTSTKWRIQLERQVERRIKNMLELKQPWEYLDDMLK